MLCECWQAVLIRRCACVTDQRPELPDSTPKSGDRWYRLRGEARGGRGGGWTPSRSSFTESPRHPWNWIAKARTEYPAHFHATNPANLSQNIILVTIHRTTCGSSSGPTSATLSPTPGTLRARLQMTEARTERLRPTLHRKTIGSTIKTSRKERKTCQRQRSERLASLSRGELVGSSSPELESPSFPRDTCLVSRGLPCSLSL